MSWTNRPSLGPGSYPRGQQMEEMLDTIQDRDVIAYGNRGSNSSGFTAEAGVMRLDNIPIRNGRRYLIMAPPIHIFSTVANDDVGASLHYTTDGTAATTSSTTLHTDISKVSGASVDRGGTVAPFGILTGPADAVLSVLLSALRVNGGGTCNLLASMSVLVIAYGDAVSDTGVDL